MNTKRDICFSLSRYLLEPRRVHIVAAKHMMRYLKGTLDFGLLLTLDQVLGLRQLVEGGAQDEVNITGSRPLFGFLGICNGNGILAHGFTHV